MSIMISNISAWRLSITSMNSCHDISIAIFIYISKKQEMQWFALRIRHATLNVDYQSQMTLIWHYHIHMRTYTRYIIHPICKLQYSIRVMPYISKYVHAWNTTNKRNTSHLHRHTHIMTTTTKYINITGYIHTLIFESSVQHHLQHPIYQLHVSINHSNHNWKKYISCFLLPLLGGWGGPSAI